MATTVRLNITELQVGQSGGETLFNEAFNKLDAIVFPTVKDRDLTAPPGSEAEGDTYIPKATATGTWAGEEDSIAIFDNGYKFVQPDEGMVVYVDDEKIFIKYDGTNWVNDSLPKLNVESKSSNYPIVAAQDTGKLFVSTAAITITLPAATVGQHYFFSVGSANNLTITVTGSDTVSLPETGIPGATSKGIVAGAIAESIHLACAIATNWISLGGNNAAGIWVAEV